MEKHKNKQRLKTFFTDNGVTFHDDVIDEIIELAVNTGLTKEFVRIWKKNLDILHSLGINAVETKNFELLQGTDGLYSMKFKGKTFNWRMLYSYDETTDTIMLHFFYERDDSKKDMYSSHIPIAQKRRKEMEGRR